MRNEKSYKTLISELKTEADEQGALIEDERRQKNDLLNQRKTFEQQIKSQEALTRQNYNTLLEAEEEHQKQIQVLNKRILQNENSLENLTKQYHSARKAAENARESNRRLNGVNTQLTDWIHALKTAFEALTSARRWKLACRAGRIFEVLRLRPKSPTAVDKIHGIFGLFEYTLQPHCESVPQVNYVDSYDGELLISWMEQLQRAFPAFVGSRRWRLGNATIRLVEKLLFRPKVLLAPEHMASIFSEFENWQQKILLGDQRKSLPNYTIEQLCEWLRKLDHDFQATLACRRWRFGSAMARILMRLAFRPQVPLVTDHMQEIFRDFRQKTQLDGGALHSEVLAPTEQLANDKPSQPNKKQRNSINILFVLYESIDSNGGLHVQLHASRLAALGAECRFAAPTRKPPVHANEKIKKQMGTFAQMEKEGPGFSDGRGPDVIHAWTPREIVRVFCQKMLKKYPCPLIIHLEDNEFHLTEVAVGVPFSKLEKMPKKKLNKLIPGTCYHPIKGREFLASAQGLTMIIDTLSPFNFAEVPTMVLPAPVDERLFYPRSLNLPLRKELGIADGHLVLAYTGNVHAANRDEVLELYRAVHLLNEQGCPSTLIRTGANGIPLGEETWITAHEKKLGWVERNRVPDILAAADMLVQPGTPGPFNDQRVPSKLPEYFAMGRPVILPRTNLGLKVDHQLNGFVLENADAESIARAILEIRKDVGKAGKLAMGAAGFYRSELSGIELKTLMSFYTMNISNKKTA